MAKNGRPDPKTTGTWLTTTGDQPEPERLAADLTGGHVDDPVAGEILGGGNRLLDAVDERERCGVGVLPVRRRPVGDDEDVLAGGRLAVQPLVRSNTRRPMTFAAMSPYRSSMKSAEARVLRTSSSLPGKLQVTSPLPNQSNIGPTPSLSSAMNPSRDTTAPMIVLPMMSPFACELPPQPVDSTAAASQYRRPVDDYCLRLRLAENSGRS